MTLGALALDDESVWKNEGKISDGLTCGGIHPSAAFGCAEDGSRFENRREMRLGE